MSDKMKIDVALTNLEAGKFSFGMVDAIKDHISGLENELELARGRHDSVIGDIKLQQIANWRLEGELTKLNAQIYALLRANILTEKAYGGVAFVGMKTGEYAEVARKYAAAALEQVIADLKSGKLQSQLVDSSAKIYVLLREIMPTKSALRELTPYANKAGEYAEVARKFAGAALERTIADLRSGKLQSQLLDSSAKIYALLKEITPTKSALRELTPHANKAGESLAVLKKYVSAYVEKARAYLSSLHKTAA